ncbi:MAG: hypothetical protein A2V46_07975 [Bacteroidetes bacterium RBG_19FT_COMBO_42_7]|nr:MAG: hypothetical protein A2V46_07975 [Bacteroidetes bacterium RBG_19FT_COMBO_42_7]
MVNKFKEMTMKNLFHSKGIHLLIALFFLAANFQSIPGQTGAVKVSAIPDDINKIFQTSCYGCHGPNGKLLPMTKLNFSKWTEYDAVKGAGKAANICTELAEEAMPPKSVRKSNPELIPTKEQTLLICKWAVSLKPKE